MIVILVRKITRPEVVLRNTDDCQPFTRLKLLTYLPLLDRAQDFAISCGSPFVWSMPSGGKDASVKISPVVQAVHFHNPEKVKQALFP